MKKAIATLEKGSGGAFRQTHGATVLKRMLQLDSPMMGNLMDADRDDLANSLAAPAHGNEYAPQSGKTVGILKQLLGMQFVGAPFVSQK